MASDENPVVAAALKILPLYGVECWRNNAIRVPGRRFNGKKGRGDVIGLTKSALFVNIELKKPDGEESKDQIEFRELVTARGGVAICAYSVSDLVLQVEDFARRGYFS